jgi:hypothetical protein
MKQGRSSLLLCVCLAVWQREEMGGNQSKNTLLESMINNFKKDLMETTELTPNKLNILCKVDWPAFGVGWPPEGSLDKTVINEVYRVIVKKEQTPRRMGKAKKLKLVFKNQTLLSL